MIKYIYGSYCYDYDAVSMFQGIPLINKDKIPVRKLAGD